MFGRERVSRQITRWTDKKPPEKEIEEDRGQDGWMLLTETCTMGLERKMANDRKRREEPNIA